MELHRVHLALLAVTPESCPRAELRVRAELALDGPHPSALPLGLGRQEHRSMPLRQGSRDLAEVVHVFGVLLKDKLLLHRAPHVAPRFYLLSPHDPGRLLMLKGFHRPSQDTKSQQRSGKNSPCCRGREPLRSASRRLGFFVDICLGPSARGSTSAFRRLHYPKDPCRARLAPLSRAAWSIVDAVFVVNQQDNHSCRFLTFDDYASQGKSMGPPPA